MAHLCALCVLVFNAVSQRQDLFGFKLTHYLIAVFLVLLLPLVFRPRWAAARS
jgi:hypothetical protein